MGIVIHQTGDIFDSTAQGIGHGVNTRGVMGHGIAVQFRKRFPDMYETYRKMCYTGQPRPLFPGDYYPYELEDGRTVFNLASQDEPGPHARLDWLETAVFHMLDHAQAKHYDRVALPRIGAGVGGLNWSDVESVLESAVKAYDVDIEVWTLP